MCCPVCGIVHIKYPLLLIRKSSPCGDSTGFPLLLCEWSVPGPCVQHHITIELSTLLNEDIALINVVYMIVIGSLIWLEEKEC